MLLLPSVGAHDLMIVGPCPSVFGGSVLSIYRKAVSRATMSAVVSPAMARPPGLATAVFVQITRVARGLHGLCVKDAISGHPSGGHHVCRVLSCPRDLQDPIIAMIHLAAAVPIASREEQALAVRAYNDVTNASKCLRQVSP